MNVFSTVTSLKYTLQFFLVLVISAALNTILFQQNLKMIISAGRRVGGGVAHMTKTGNKSILFPSNTRL
jgi:hypothetical protein